MCKIISFLWTSRTTAQKRKPNIRLAGEALEWEPKIPLKEGLQKTIDYFDDLLANGFPEPDVRWQLARVKAVAN